MEVLQENKQNQKEKNHNSFGMAVEKFVSSHPGEKVRTETLRASQLYFLCPRAFVLGYFGLQEREVDWLGRLRMSTGTFLHEYLQDRVLGPMGILFGNWKNKDEVREGFHPDSEKAIYEIVNQKPLSWKYEEYRSTDPKYKFSGHIDGKIDIDKLRWIDDNKLLFQTEPLKACKRLQEMTAGRMSILEIKTTSKASLDKIGKQGYPPDYYKQQAVIYQKMFDIDSTFFWYFERDNFDQTAFIYRHEEKWWNEAIRKAEYIWKCVREKKLPEAKKLCPSTKYNNCKYCKNTWTEKEFDDYISKSSNVD